MFPKTGPLWKQTPISRALLSISYGVPSKGAFPQQNSHFICESFLRYIRANTTAQTPRFITPRSPAVTTPRSPAVTTPRSPAVTTPRSPAVTTPRSPAVTTPRSPAVTTPRSPAVTTPRSPAVTTPRSPAVTHQPVTFCKPKRENHECVRKGSMAASSKVLSVNWRGRTEKNQEVPADQRCSNPEFPKYNVGILFTRDTWCLVLFFM